MNIQNAVAKAPQPPAFTTHMRSIILTILFLLVPMLFASTASSLILKIAANRDPVLPGGAIVYDIMVSNDGTSSVAGVSVDGSVPSGLNTFSSNSALPALPTGVNFGSYVFGNPMSWNLGTLAAGESRNIRLSVAASSTAANGTTIALTLQASGAGVASTPATRQVVVENNKIFDLRVNADKNPVAPGGQIRYTLVYANSGSAPTAFNTVLKVPIPAGTTFVSASDGAVPSAGVLQWPLGTLAAGISGQKQFVVAVPLGTPEGAIIVAEPDITDDTNYNGRSSTLCAVRSVSPLGLEIAASPDPAASSGAIVYDITVSNDGTSSVTGVSLDGSVPSGLDTFSSNSALPALPTGVNGGLYVFGNPMSWNLGTLAAGESRNIRLSVVANPSAANGTPIVLALRASGIGVAETLSTRQVVVNNNRVFGLKVSADKNPVAPGGQIRYTLTYANRSASTTALNTVLKVPIPAGTTLISASDGVVPSAGVLQWPLGTLAAGISGQTEFIVAVPLGTPEGTIIVAEPEMNDDTNDQARSSALSAIKTVSPLTVQIVANPDPVATSGALVYNIQVTNNGPTSVAGVTLDGPVPGGLATFNSSSALPALPTGVNGGLYVFGNPMSWNLGTLAAGESRNISLSVAVSSSVSVANGYLIALTLRASGTSVAETLSTKTIPVDSRPFGSPAGTLKFSLSGYNVSENAGAITLTVTRTGGSNGEVTVHYETTGGTATEGTDYTATYGTLKWLTGDSTSKTVTVPVANDGIPDSGETFTMTLTNTKRGASLGAPVVTTVTIMDPSYAISPIASPPEGGTASGGGPAVPAGTSVTVVATPNGGYSFVNWTESGVQVSTAASYNFTANANRTLVANFSLINYLVTPSAGPNGSISPNSVQTVGSGGSVAFTATPALTYTVDQWLVDGIPVRNGGGAFTLQNVTASRAVHVTFKPGPVTWTVTPNAGPNGSITPNTAQVVNDGGSANFTATPSAGYEVDQWTTNGIVVQTGVNSYTASNITENISVQVTFKPVVYAVTPSAGANGSISPNTVQNVPSGGSVTFTATPGGGYTVNQWLLDGGVVQPGGNSFTRTNVTAPHTVQVTFNPSGPAKAQMISPLGGTTLTASSVAFTWNSGTGVTAYALWVGSTAGGYDLFAQVVTGNSRTVTLPADGRAIYVRLFSLIGGAYQSIDYIYTALDGRSKMTDPAGGAVLGAASPTFTWNAGIGVSANFIWVGSAPGGYDLFAAATPGLSRSIPLPADGRKVYVRLWSAIAGRMASVDYSYTTFDARAVMTVPVDGVTLGGSLVTFQWSGSANAIWVGSTFGGYDLFAAALSGSSRTITLPTDGRPIYVTLWSLTNGTFVQNRYIYTAATPIGAMKAQIIAPVNGSTLASASLPLAWNAGVGASQYVLYVGSTPGGYDLFVQGLGASLSRSVTVPTDGRPLYVTLYSLIAGAWLPNSYYYTAMDGRATMTSPADGSTLASANVTFNWDAGTGATAYALWVGSTPSGYDLLAVATGTSRSRTVTLPADGRMIYVTLHSLISGAYKANTYSYRAAGP